MKKLLGIILALSMVLSLGTAALAGDTEFTRAADLTYRGISIVVNGTKIVPQDANGNPVEPFIMDGSTFLPVRAVAGALGLDVEWDGATSTISLTSGGSTVYGSGTPLATNRTEHVDITYRGIELVYDGYTIYATTEDNVVVEPFIYNGTTYLPVRGVASALGLDVSWDGATSTVTLKDGAREMLLLKRETQTHTYDDGSTFKLVTTYEYDEDGREILATTTGGDMDETVRTFYDNNGIQVKKEYTGNYGFYTVYYEISKDGLTERDYAVGDVEWEEITTYDTDGNIVSDTYTDEDSTIKYVYTNDEDGYMESCVTYMDGAELRRAVYTYTDDGMVIVTTGLGAGREETVYTDNGYKTTFVSADPDELSYTEECTYGQFDSSRKDVTITRYSDGSEYYHEYSYDEDSRLVSETVRTPYGYGYVTVYEYETVTVG